MVESQMKKVSTNNFLEKEINLTPKYVFMGYSNLNFYKILSKNDAMILKQSSKIFQSYSPLYNKHPNENNPQINLIGDSANEEPKINLIKCLIFEDVQNPFSEDIVFNGHIIGKVEGLIEIKKIPLIKQILCGIHTENGFDISSIYLHNNPSHSTTTKSGSHREIPNELRVLISQKNNLLEKFFPSTLKNLEDKIIEKENEIPNTNEPNDMFTYSLSNERIKIQNQEQNQNLFVDPKATSNLLNDIKTSMKKSCKESVLIYNLINQSDILLAQREMIDLGINLINILTKEDLIDTRRIVVFDILILLFNRAEIDLRLMAFDWKTEPSIEKLEVSRDFIELLNKTLSYCLEKLAAGKSADLDTNEFVEFFLSISYFRIPIFRKIFINTINLGISETESREIFKILDKETDILSIHSNQNSKLNMSEYIQLQANDLGVENVLLNSNLINEGNLIENSKTNEMKNEEDNAIDINPVNSLIDWETLFYDRIDNISRTTSNTYLCKELQEILDKIKETENIINSLEWKVRISKRGNAFFSMIIRLEKYIQSKVVILRNLRWVKIPGFKFIINAIIHELKKRDVAQFQEPLVKLMTIFINDSDISNLFINTIIKRTK